MTSGSLCVLQSTFILCYSQPAFRPPFGCLLNILFASSEFKYSSRGQGTTYRDYYLALSQSLPVDRHNKAKIFPLDMSAMTSGNNKHMLAEASSGSLQESEQLEPRSEELRTLESGRIVCQTERGGRRTVCHTEGNGGRTILVCTEGEGR